jgi:uncharacterized protein
MVNSRGRFVWYELMTTDIAAAKAFYSKVMGWGTEEVSTPGMPYVLFITGKTSIGGLMKLPVDAGRVGASPSWIGYVAVDDVDGGAARVKQLGGAVYVEPTDIPGISRFAVVADPQMAAFVLVKWLRPRADQPADLHTIGRVGWHELLTVECDKAMAFYGELFGWQKVGIDATTPNPYQLFSAEGQTIGAIVAKPATMPVPFWLYYFNVDDIDAAAKRVTAGGGDILNGPLQAPDGSWFVGCTDPQGAMFALVSTRNSRAIGYFESTSSSGPGGAPAKRWSW